MPWLFKTEPQTFSFADLLVASRQRALWEGVRNYEAHNLLRAARLGEPVLVYHSSTRPPSVAGLAVVSREAEPDPAQFSPESPYYDPKATPDAPRWDAVTVRAWRELPRYVTLGELRAEPRLRGLRLLRRGNRLSVLPVSEAEFGVILRLGGLKAAQPGGAEMSVTEKTGVRAAAAALFDATVAQRRDFHRHPETAFEELRTAGIIAEKLSALGLDVRRVAQTGVVAVLEGAAPGRTVLARADIDALPIHDEKAVPYRSEVPGKMHACGHDGHAAALLSVAELLSGLRETLRGRVVFVFQPAEETVGGAAVMLREGALTGLAPDAVVGLHLSSEYPVGTVQLRAGPSMASTDSFRVVLHGSGGHAAKPHVCADPIVMAARVVGALQTLVARETDPEDSAVVSVTSVHGGTAYNIIPEAVELKGTLRTFLPGTRDHLKGRLEALCRGEAELGRGHATFGWIDASPAVVNDPVMTERLRRVAAGVVGAENVGESSRTMGGDDMSLWLQQAPGCYFFVGARNPDLGADKPHHHPRFDLDERSLMVAVETLALGVLDFLEP